MAKHIAKHTRQTSRQEKPRLGYLLLGLPALFPLICVYPDIVHMHLADLVTGASDTLGTGAELTFLVTLLISPLIIITGNRWFFPLRKWYGVMTGVIAVVAGIIAPILSIKFGPMYMTVGTLSLATGYLLVILLIPLLFISNKFSAKKLGKYWSRIQKRLTYAVWGLLAFHLFVLYGDSGKPFYLFVACSVPLIVYRMPIVRKASMQLRKSGLEAVVYIMSIPWIALFMVPFLFIINEEVFKGVATITGHSIAN